MCACGTRRGLDLDMSTEFANWIVTVCGGYLALGAVFALAFVSFGAGRIDPDAKGMPCVARCLLLPGAALLWPVMLFKWFKQKAPPAA
jgi:hypothetical protein